MIARDVWIVFSKEVMDNFRDRRSLILAMVYPLIGALFLGTMMAMVGGMMKSQGRAQLQIPVIGIENGPSLIAYLEKRNAVIVPGPEDPAHAVREGLTAAVLIIPKGMEQDIADEKTVTLQIVVNPARLSTVLMSTRISRIVGGFSQQITKARLKAHNISQETTRPIVVKNQNVGRTRNISGFFINMLPPFIMFSIFVGGIYLAIDATAGERERGSLEPLLTNPVPRGQIMMGKALATCLFTMLTLTLQLLAFKIMFMIVGGSAGKDIDPPILNFILIFLICAPLVAFAVGVQIVIATYSRSYKETQTYLALLPLIPSIPGMVLVFVSIHSQDWMMLIPTFSQALLVGKLVQQETVLWTEVILSCGSTLFFAAALFVYAKRLYNNDKVLFGAG
jgi:sodium transport system permease protein